MRTIFLSRKSWLLLLNLNAGIYESVSVNENRELYRQENIKSLYRYIPATGGKLSLQILSIEQYEMKPLNLETLPTELIESYFASNIDLFYIRDILPLLG